MKATKICTRCKQEKNTILFSKNKKSKDGLSWFCKTCLYETAKQWKKNNPDKIQQQKQRYYQRHKEGIDKHNKQLRLKNKERYNHNRKIVYGKNKEKYQQRSRIYYSKNRDKIKKYVKEWCQVNPDKVNASHHARRIKIQQAYGNYTDSDVQQLLYAQKNKCLSCGKKFTKKNPYTIDHIVPISKNGRNDILNLQLLCKVCNCTKNAKTKDFRKKGVLKQIFKQKDFFIK